MPWPRTTLTRAFINEQNKVVAQYEKGLYAKMVSAFILSINPEIMRSDSSIVTHPS